MKKYLIIFGLYSLSLFGASSSRSIYDAYAAIPAEERDQMLNSIYQIRSAMSYSPWSRDSAQDKKRVNAILSGNFENLQSIHERNSVPLPTEPDVTKMLADLEIILQNLGSTPLARNI